MQKNLARSHISHFIYMSEILFLKPKWMRWRNSYHNSFFLLNNRSLNLRQFIKHTTLNSLHRPNFFVTFNILSRPPLNNMSILGYQRGSRMPCFGQVHGKVSIPIFNTKVLYNFHQDMWFSLSLQSLQSYKVINIVAWLNWVYHISKHFWLFYFPLFDLMGNYILPEAYWKRSKGIITEWNLKTFFLYILHLHHLPWSTNKKFDSCITTSNHVCK